MAVSNAISKNPEVISARKIISFVMKMEYAKAVLLF